MVKRIEVIKLFNNLATYYELLNIINSFGMHYIWRRKSLRILNCNKDDIVLDIGGGTGFSSQVLQKIVKMLVVYDISFNMLSIGSRKNKNIFYLLGNGIDIPFDNNTVDKIILSFSLRNMESPESMLREALRIIKQNGRIVVCEFSWPRNRIIAYFYNLFFKIYILQISKLFGNNFISHYRYLLESIKKWPQQTRVIEFFKNAGWSNIKCSTFNCGILSIYTATKI